jgi:transposase-like protein
MSSKIESAIITMYSKGMTTRDIGATIEDIYGVQVSESSISSIYLMIGVNRHGYKDVPGMWINETESASFWLNALNDLKDRGVEDILITWTDNLAGIKQAIQAIFPFTTTQLCVVHQIRNSCRYVVWKEKKAFVADLKQIYAAINKEAAEYALKDFESKWDSKCTETKTVFPDDQAALKTVNLAIQNVQKKWHFPIRYWGQIYNQFIIKIEERCRG